MSYEFLEVRREGHISQVILNRPDKLNALNTGIMEEVEAVSRSFLDDEQTRVVIFRGAGKHFCAGADLKQKVSTDDSMVVRIIGHSGTQGDADANLALSQDRAAVRVGRDSTR